MSTPFIIFLAIAGAVLLVLLVILVLAIFQTQRLARIRANLPPRPAFRCPTCNDVQINVLSTGLWDGKDTAGNGTGGIFEYGICRSCGGRCARYVDDQPYLPAEEEWQGHFGPLEKWHQQTENWPFCSDNENLVA